MLKRDYSVKQFEEFGKVIGLILGLKRDGNFADLNDVIREASQKFTATEIDYVESIDNELLLKTLIEEKKLTDEQLKMLADLLFEKAEYYLKTSSHESLANNCYRKVLLIYTFLKDNATLNYSLDMHYKLEILSKMNL